MPGTGDLPPELTGERLHGEGLDEAGLAAWFADEQDGYAGIAGQAGAQEAGGSNHAASYHAFRFLGSRTFDCCLALGPAAGREYGPLAGKVRRFVAVEPGRAFWRPTIAGNPAEYRMPTLRGALDLADGACDLAVSLGVLHHVPNVAEVLREIARVLRPGAPFLLREPITSLGDFRRPRPGLTRNERGIPHATMDRLLGEAAFRIVGKRFVNFPGTRELPARLGLRNAWDHPLVVRLDAAVSRLTAWNARYWRPRLVDKLAPRAAYWVAEKAGERGGDDFS